MVTLPEKTRKVLMRVVNQLQAKPNIYGVALFGSVSRGEAAGTSDVDVLVLDGSGIEHEHVERIGVVGCPVDLDYIPKQWLARGIPPSIDQKLFEMQILYDRDWSLTNTKLIVMNSYVSRDRVNIRTEMHVVQSDILLSRATSAFSRNDFQSAYLFATMALEEALKILCEITLVPLSNSHILERFECSAKQLGMHTSFDEYVNVSNLRSVDVSELRERIRHFRTLWDEVHHQAGANAKAFESLHPIVRADLGFFLTPFLLQGTLARIIDLVDSGMMAEASHYLTHLSADFLENYLWLLSAIKKAKVDSATLIRSLVRLNEKNPLVSDRLVALLALERIGEAEAASAIQRSRENVLAIRRQRMIMIDRGAGSSFVKALRGL